MTFSDAPDGTETNLAENLFVASLPAAVCSACGDGMKRRSHRVMLRATWRPKNETLCPDCWRVITEWAARFALRQMELDLA